ncbi:MAG: hypothetical protein AAF757_21170 [Cyanobacteria bacterium P01_D01_bin.116]|mgnify:CR=1 FL=1
MKSKKLFSAIFSTGIGVLLLLQGCSSEGNVKNNSINKDANNKAKSAKPVDPLAKFDKAKSTKLTDTAKLLAGMEVGSESPLAKVQQVSSWNSHQNYYKNAWSRLENQQLAKVRKWREKELQAINAKSPIVFYPFSGPDFLYSFSLFPKAKKMILVGLEPVGSVPDFAKLSANESAAALSKARSSLSEILQFSFFRTNDMKVDLRKQGVLPILYVFMARTNNRILNLQYIGLDKNAKVKQFEKGMVPGLKIAFVPQGESEPRTLYYFSTDLSNDGLTKHPELTQFVSQLNEPVTYLKAASYLMYNGSFSGIRDTILATSSHVLQDDSGMPLKSFDSAKWDLEFYGNYSRPIGLFSSRYQADLRRVYASNKDIQPLDFGIGYKFNVNQSNMMLAKIK